MIYYNASQSEIIESLNKLNEGEELHIATSNYSIDPNPHTGWNPQHRAATSTVTALIRKGYKVEKIWRGAIFTK